jgi:hypothetical protein
MRSRGDEIFIEPPAESKLVVNFQSQLLTGLLSSELANHGFTLKELPVEMPDNEGKVVSFVVSLDLLRRLNEDYGVKAVLIGNVYLSPERYQSSTHLVNAAYLKLVDVETLDILCHISVIHENEGVDLEATAQAVAAELAGMANLPSKEVGLGPPN